GGRIRRRRRRLTAGAFAQALVFPWPQKPRATFADRLASLAELGCPLSASALHQRFTARAAAFFRGLLEAAVGLAVAPDPVALPAGGPARGRPGLLRPGGPGPPGRAGGLLPQRGPARHPTGRRGRRAVCRPGRLPQAAAWRQGRRADPAGQGPAAALPAAGHP